jgi:predicted house-cleaning noncanonical NTP pyrophosphatase (MazG superfamily)
MVKAGEIIYFDKLVRNGMPQIVKANGDSMAFGIANDESLEKYIRSKILEEAVEYHESGSLEELADLYTIVLEASQKHGGIKALIAEADRKTEERGDFSDGLIMLYGSFCQASIDKSYK